MDGNCGGHDALAVGRDSVEVLVRHFGNEAMAAQGSDLAVDSGAAASGLNRIDRRFLEEPTLDIAVSKADGGVLAGDGGPEERQVRM